MSSPAFHFRLATLDDAPALLSIYAPYVEKTAISFEYDVPSLVHFDTSSRLFQNCPKTAPVARYHSLAADAATMPDCLKVTAVTDDGEIMAVQHTDYPIYGVQFHPESIMTPNGKTMLENFLKEN